MTASKFQISLSYEQILDLIHQLSEDDIEKLREELIKMRSISKLNISTERVKAILLDVKHYFSNKLGKFTHKKASKDWFFYGLGFSREDLGYVFGFNIGFFYKSEVNLYEKIGMNILVRTNGVNSIQRQKYLNFFRTKLTNWQNTPEANYYTVERDGKGIEFGRYADINEFNNEYEVLTFLYECIDGIHNIYKEIVNNEENIFEKIVRASPPWKETIIELCEKKLIN